ncbi:unnamed protein product, partial [Ectocarpus sp. 12 AP-2014]
LARGRACERHRNMRIPGCGYHNAAVARHEICACACVISLLAVSWCWCVLVIDTHCALTLRTFVHTRDRGRLCWFYPAVGVWFPPTAARRLGSRQMMCIGL